MTSYAARELETTGLVDNREGSPGARYPQYHSQIGSLYNG
jgi:hypothetical protein